MSFPTQACNMVGAQMLSLTDLTLPATIASGGSSDSVGWTTGIPATVLVVATASSGAGGILRLKVGTSAAIDMTSGTTDKAYAAFGSQYNTINTSTANPFVRLRVTDTSGSSGFSQFAVFTFYVLTQGENWTDIKSGVNACASTKLGDGTGIANLSPQ